MALIFTSNSASSVYCTSDRKSLGRVRARLCVSAQFRFSPRCSFSNEKCFSNAEVLHPETFAKAKRLPIYWSDSSFWDFFFWFVPSVFVLLFSLEFPLSTARYRHNWIQSPTNLTFKLFSNVIFLAISGEWGGIRQTPNDFAPQYLETLSNSTDNRKI